jgi:hypothetical protein
MAYGNGIMAQQIAPVTTLDFIDTQQGSLMHLKLSKFDQELQELMGNAHIRLSKKSWKAHGKLMMAHDNGIMAQPIAPVTTADYIDTQQPCVVHLKLIKIVENVLHLRLSQKL